MINLEMIQEAQKLLEGVARKTPLEKAPTIGDHIWIKAENLQLTGAFKIRGAFNKIAHLTKEEAAHGVIACSAGNHAQGIAYSATQQGIKSVICMPADAPLMKVQATKNYGAEVVLVPGVYDDAQAEAERLSKEKGYTFAHPFEDPYVMAGQGTIGLEILDQLDEVEQVVVPVGGGGLISGVATAIKSLKPSVKVIGVQSENVPAMVESFKKGSRVTSPNKGTIADGIHVLTPGQETFKCIQKYVDEMVTVNEDEIAAAIVRLMEDQKTVAEGAGATTVAAYLFKKIDTSLNTVCVVSGGNVDINQLQRTINRGLHYIGRQLIISIKLPDASGNLLKVLQIMADNKVNILDIEHHRGTAETEVQTAMVTFSLETIDGEHAHKLLDALDAAGYSVKIK